MRYTLEFKLRCIELYRQGIWVETPEGIKDPQNFHKMIRRWEKIEEHQGISALHHKSQKKRWTLEERFNLVSKVLEGKSIEETACKAGLNPGQLHLWVKKYKDNGYDGLKSISIGRPRKNQVMKKNQKTRKLLQKKNEMNYYGYEMKMNI